MENSKKRQSSNLARRQNTPLKTQLPDQLLSHVTSFLGEVFKKQQLDKPNILVAFSGGLDSAVLLHILSESCQSINFSLTAMHVHHGLSTHADEWAMFCKDVCLDSNISFELHEIAVDQDSGLGVEASARFARYQALHSQGADFICVAHHQDDQAETLLLQLARGAGVKGLASMAKVDVERQLLRPLLNCSRVDLQNYANTHRLKWVLDESNADTQYDRNFVRHEVLPILRKRYKNIANILSRSASNLADASDMLDDLAKIDAEIVVNKNDQYLSVSISQLLNLTSQRQGNLIRWWLAQNKIVMPSAQLLKQILQQICHAKLDAKVKIKVAQKCYVMRYKGIAYLVNEAEFQQPINILWQGESLLTLPDHSRLVFTEKLGKGFAFQRGGSDIKLRIKYREGGERFKPDLLRPSRTLKYILQACHMPPWQRESLPLIFMDETLVIVPNIGVGSAFKAKEDELGLEVTWSIA